MKKILVTFVVITLVVYSSWALAGVLDKYEKKPVPRPVTPKVYTKILENGMTLFLLEDHNLPSVYVKVITRTGSIYTVPEKAGLTDITGFLMIAGGAGSLSPEQFDKQVDELGIEISSHINREIAETDIAVLSQDTEKGLGLLFDVLFKPQFNEKRLAVTRLKIGEKLKREDDDPGALASRNFRQLVYGDSSPWARRPTNTTLENVSVEDIRSFHSKYFKTNQMILAASGDFKIDEFVDLIKRLTKDSPFGEVSFPNVPEVVPEFTPAVKNISKPLTQSFIRMGHLGVKRTNPDKYALTIMSDILGAGNFKSRLMEDIRTKRGYAYSVWSDMSFGSDLGLFVVGVDTKAAQGQEVVDIISRHVKKMASEAGITSSELTFAKQSILSRFAFEFDSLFKIVSRRAVFRYYGYPDNYWQIYYDKMSAVDVSDVKRVASKYLHPDGLKIVIVGPKAVENSK